MSYRKRDYRYPRSSRETTVVLTKSQGALEVWAESSSPGSSDESAGEGEEVDALCDSFHEIRTFVENRGLPLLQLCQFPDFVDFVRSQSRKS